MKLLVNDFKKNSALAIVKVCLVAISMMFYLSLSGCKEETSNYKIPQTMADAFFKTLLTGEVSQAYEDLFKIPLIPNGPDEFEKLRQGKGYLKKQARNSLRVNGKPLSIEIVKKQSIGSHTVRLIYILNQERKPTLWELVFYEVDKHWHLIAMSQNDQPKTYAGILGQ